MLVGMAKCVPEIHEMFFHKNVSWCPENETNMLQTRPVNPGSEGCKYAKTMNILLHRTSQVTLM